MSSVIETFELGNIYVEYRWDKYNGYEVSVDQKLVGFSTFPLYHKAFYGDKDGARRYFKYQVRRVKKGEIN